MRAGWSEPPAATSTLATPAVRPILGSEHHHAGQATACLNFYSGVDQQFRHGAALMPIPTATGHQDQEFPGCDRQPIEQRLYLRHVPRRGHRAEKRHGRIRTQSMHEAFTRSQAQVQRARHVHQVTGDIRVDLHGCAAP